MERTSCACCMFSRITNPMTAQHQPTTVTQRDWFRAEQFYLNQSLTFKYVQTSPTMWAHLINHLKELQTLQVKRESHPVWSIPIKVIHETGNKGVQWGILPDLARSHLIGIQGWDAGDTSKGLNQTEIQV